VTGRPAPTCGERVAVLLVAVVVAVLVLAALSRAPSALPVFLVVVGLAWLAARVHAAAVRRSQP
jgi:hypothetical protein